MCMESSPKDLIHGLSMGPRSQQSFKCSKAILTVEPKKTHGYKMDRKLNYDGAETQPNQTNYNHTVVTELRQESLAS